MDDVATLRARIDELDLEIARLLDERRGHSREIQRLRAVTGDHPVAPARELEVQSTYAAALGEDGRALAHAVLEMCRGRH